MKRKLLVIDCETGGLDPQMHSILSFAAVVVNAGAIEDMMHLLIAEPEIIAEPEALRVNGLSVEQLKVAGVTPAQAVWALENMLQQHDMRGRVTLAGCNVAFDVGFMKRLYRLANGDFSGRFSRRTLDVQTGALLLEQAGRISLPGGSASLDSLCDHFGVPLDRGAGHSALEDAEATAQVLHKMLILLNP